MLDRARILLKADVGEHVAEEILIDKEIAGMLETSTATVQRVRERFCRGRDSMRHSSAPFPIGSTSVPWTGEPKPV